MRQTTLGQSDMSVVAAPLGAMYMGTKLDYETSERLLDHFVGLGGNFIDTANMYAHWIDEQWKGGESETVLGEWMRRRGNRNDLVISTKVGIAYDDVPTSLAPERIIEECDKSLKRLGIDTIDLYFAHRDDPNVPQEDVLGAFAKLIEQGKVRSIGASNFTTDRLATAHEIARLDGLPRYEVLQQRYTYLPVAPGGYDGPQVILSGDMIDYCTRARTSVMAYSVGLGGAYGRYMETGLPPEYDIPSNHLRMKVLQEIATETGAQLQQVVLAWVWSKPALMPLIAGSTPARLDENFAAMDITLTVEQIDRLELL